MSAPEAPTFESTDQLNLKSFCEKLEKYLLIEHDYVDGGLVVGLNAGFGAGKTTFIKMWESDLKARLAAGESAPIPVVLNAWENDYCGDPLIAILSNLLEAIDKLDGSQKEDATALREAAKDVAWFVTGLANGLAAKWAGINAVEAGKLAEEKKENRHPEVPDFVELFQHRTDALKTLKEKLAVVFQGETPQVIVFVDELDRCRPDYAVSYLEAIKHVFDIRGMVFVLAVDYDHLANSAKALFGQELVFEEYFRKFCHRVINLREPDEQGFRGLTADYVKKYLEVEDRRLSGINLDDKEEHFIELATGLKMRPRQLQEAFRIIGHACAVSDPNLRGKVYWCRTAMVVLLAFLHVAKPDTYRKIRGGKMPHEDLARLIGSLTKKHLAKWWMMIYLTGLSRNQLGEGPEVVKEILEKANLLDEGEAVTSQELQGFLSGWGHSWGDHVANTIHRIDTVDSF